MSITTFLATRHVIVARFAYKVIKLSVKQYLRCRITEIPETNLQEISK